jgi:phosphoribosylformimino-5-aminoimidazole carboxamide ribonucleotide (ProFAR) isomerase
MLGSTLLTLSCNDEKAKNDNDCKPLHYADKFEAAFIRSGGCGSLQDVEFVKEYNGLKCTGGEMVVDMEKYTSTKTDKVCQDYPIYQYTKK